MTSRFTSAIRAAARIRARWVLNHLDAPARVWWRWEAGVLGTGGSRSIGAGIRTSLGDVAIKTEPVRRAAEFTGYSTGR